MDLRRGVTVTAMAVIAAVGTSACAGGEDESTAGGGGDAATPVASKGASKDAAGGDASLVGEFQSLLGKDDAAAWKVTYRMEGGGVSADGMTIAVDGKRYAMTISSAQGDFRLVDDGSGVTYSCIADQCFSTDSSGQAGQESPAAAFTDQLEQYEQYARMKGVKTSRDTIAGRDALCGTYDGTEAGESIEVLYCVDAKTGAILRSKATSAGAGNFSMEATSVSTPAEADFAVPETAIDASKIAEMSPQELQELGESLAR